MRRNKKKKAKATATKIAVIDIGSNSVRLVIYDITEKKPSVIEQTKATCRLAEGLTEDKPRLNPQGRAKTLKALKHFHSLLKKNDVTNVIAIATAAMRAVASTAAGKSFLRKASKILGHPISIISGQKEAQLMARGIIASMPGLRGVCADLGGGSLELASVSAGRVEDTATLNLGSLTLYSESEGSTLTAAYRTRDCLADVKFLKRATGRTLYVIGGSWRAIGRVMKISMGLPIKQVHGYKVAASLARQYALAIAVRKPSFFRGMPKKISQRRAILPLAAIVMVELIDTLQPKNIVFSGYGLREGALMERLEKSKG